MIEISIGLWYVFFAFSIFFGAIMLKKALNQNFPRSQREYYLAIGIFAFVHLICRIFYYLYDFVLIGDPNLWTLGAIFGITGVTFLLYAIERNIFPKSKFILTILSIITIVLLLLLPSNLGTILQTIMLPILSIPIPLIYFYIAYKSADEFRMTAFINGLGIFIFLAGQTAHSRFFYEMGPQMLPMFYIISPILIITGSALFLYSLLRPS